MTSPSPPRSFALIGAGFVVAGVVAACGGASSTAAPATPSVVPTSAAPTTAHAVVQPTTTSPAAATSRSRSVSPTPVRTTAKPTAPTPAKTTPAKTTPAKPVTTTPTPAVTTPRASAAVAVTALETEFTIALSRTSLRPGPVTFVAENKGTTTHALGIDGPGVDKTTDDLASGASTRLTVTLVKGSYDVYCPVGNHKMLGMDVHITVG